MFHSTHPLKIPSCRKFSRKTICICLEMSLACQQCSFIQNWWQTSDLCIINRGEKTISLFHQNLQSAKFCGTKTSGGHCSIGMRRNLFEQNKGKHGEVSAQWSGGSGKQARLHLVYTYQLVLVLVFTHTSSSFNTGHWTAAGVSPRSLFLSPPWHRFLQEHSCQNNGAWSLLSAPYRCRPSRYATPAD